eukprot:m.173837 g.173837  ORF g.173837 m.173837 type:complete len:68 (+) comp39096_c0_seq4:1791-1994(+)
MMWTLNFSKADFNGDNLTDRALDREKGKNPGMQEGHGYRARDYAQELKRAGKQGSKEDKEMVVHYNG